MSEYDPVTGENWDQDKARRLWDESMSRANHQAPLWDIRGDFPHGAWWWGYWNFRTFVGRVTVQLDGFHWETRSYHTGDVIHEGVTTSIYAAYQSVVQNRLVAPDEARHAG